MCQNGISVGPESIPYRGALESKPKYLLFGGYMDP